MHLQLHVHAGRRQVLRKDEYTSIADVTGDPLCFLQCPIGTLPPIKGRRAYTVACGFSKLHLCPIRCSVVTVAGKDVASAGTAETLRS
ncbi:MAG: hypothetical protein ABSG52_01790 [Terriglobales bacterium]